MKSKLILNFAMLFGASVVLCTIRASGQTWQTVDDYIQTNNAAPGGEPIPWSVACDGASGVYVAGDADTTTAGHTALVRYSPDGGTSWSTVDDFSYPGSTGTYFHCLYVDRRGGVFAVGGYILAGGSGNWMVRRSLDHGRTWTTVDTISSAGYTNANAWVVTSDTNGTIYVLGQCDTGCLVRVSTNQGTSWRSASGAPPVLGQWSAVCIGSTLYVLTHNYGSSAQSLWSSGDGGSAWTQVNGAVLPPSPILSSSALAADPQGNLYVAGTDASNANWVVSTGAPDGTGWTITDDYTPADFAVGVTSDPMGNIYVVGRVSDDSPTEIGEMWQVRQLSPGAGQWSTIDRFAVDPDYHNMPHGIACDSSGNVFCVGIGFEPNVGTHWIVRKLTVATPPAPPPSLQTSASGSGLTISWPASATGFTLQSSDSLGAAAVWSSVPQTPQIVGSQNVVTLPATNGVMFFRLSQ